MVTFSTEFPVRPIADRAAFVAQVVSWLRGINQSSVLEQPNHKDIDGDNAHIIAASGEQFNLREIRSDSGLTAIGFRHDIPDGKGRLWRTESVLRKFEGQFGQDLVRVRTQCVAQTPTAVLHVPKKPYLIKSILRDNWGGRDGIFEVRDAPIFFDEDITALQTANHVISGRATRHLPVLYISAIDNGKWIFPQRQIERLAFDLGGIAHIAVEPSRDFSLRLRDSCHGANAYGGSIALCLPESGVVRKLYLGVRIPTTEALLQYSRDLTTDIRSHMPTSGWDWSELQEQALRHQRERDRKRLSSQETEKLYEEEISELQARISELEERLSKNVLDRTPTDIDDPLSAYLSNKIGPEIYEGEFYDRVKLAAQEVVRRADQIGIDRRSMAVLSAISDSLPTSSALHELQEGLKRATRDPKRMPREVTSLLSRHGYREKSDKNHVRLEPKERYTGLDSITMPKTPSDYRSPANTKSQIEQILGIHKL